jgi:hypothetical protein
MDVGKIFLSVSPILPPQIQKKSQDKNHLSIAVWKNRET